MNRTATFHATYSKLPARFYERVRPARVPEPKLLAWNQSLADELGLGELEDDARLFSGNELPPGADPIALAYAGHQFGQFVPRLGDGRAVLLGELPGSDGRLRDIQLKGSGRTPFSRGGDGKSWLGPVIREYLLSEAMHAMGVPTTRALAAVTTGEQVFREAAGLPIKAVHADLRRFPSHLDAKADAIVCMGDTLTHLATLDDVVSLLVAVSATLALPGGILTRVAASHVRVGTFEYFAARQDADAVQKLLDFAIERHYPDVRDDESPRLAFFGKVVEAQAELVAHWMSIGFIHGVMNTDNTTVSGETLDYGPCAFMDEFEYGKVFSSIDVYGRYAFGRQPSIAHWNLARLADCLLLLGDEPSVFEEELDRFAGLFESAWLGRMRRKLGLTTSEPGDGDLVGEWLAYLQENGLDFTLSFRRLATRLAAEGRPEFGEAEEKWGQRVKRQPEDTLAIREMMDDANPLFIPRNHQVERAIRSAVDGDFTVFRELDRLLRRPFEEQPEFARYGEPPEPADRVERTFCGT